jgi:tetratricopeptide (TPR) repeat protein
LHPLKQPYAVAGWRLIRSLCDSTLHPLAIAAFLGPWCFWFTSSFYVSSRWTGPNTNLWFVVGLFLALGNFVGRQERERSVESGATVGAILESSLQDGRIGVDCVGAIHTAEEATSCRPATPLPSWQGELPLPITPDQSDAETDSAPVLLTPPHHISPAAISGALTALLATTLIAGGYLIFAARSWMADHALRNNMMHTECDGGDIRQAVEEAERARDLRPSDPSIYYKLAYSYLVDSRPHVALDGYRTLQSIAPNYAQLHINLAYLNDQLGYRATALFERDRAAAIEHNVRNHRDAAQNWLSFGSPGRAVAHLRHALTVDVDRTMQRIGWIRWHQHDEILVDLARLHLAQGETRQALVSLERSLRLNPDNQAAGLLLAGIEAPPDLRDAVARMMANLAARSLNNPALIIEALEKAMAERRFAEALALAAQAVEGLSLPPLGDQLDQDAVEFGNAILKNLQALFAAEVERPRCFALAGWIFACQGRYAEAENFLEQAYATLRDPRIAEQLGQVKARVAN